MRSFKCCICGHDFTGDGNNPSPYKDSGTCCDICNIMFVIPERIKLTEECRRRRERLEELKEGE